MQSISSKFNQKTIIFILLVLISHKVIVAKENLRETNKASLNKLIAKKNAVKDTLVSLEKEYMTLQQAKATNNWIQIADSYRVIMYKAGTKDLMKYADSLLWATHHTNQNDYIGKAYHTKGILYYNQKELKKALDNYLLADQYLVKTKNNYAIHKVKYSIAHTKYYLGFYHEAIALLKECMDYFEEENDLAFLNTLYSLGLCYNKIGDYNKTTYYNNLGLKTGKEYQNNTMAPYFQHSEGVNSYHKKEYSKAINQLNQVLPFLKQKNDFANETVAYFYLGKSYWKLNNKSKAINYCIKVDQAFAKYQYIRPDLRENYELLINYYRQQNNTQKQLKYINMLLKVDSTLSHNYKYLSGKIHKEYDTKKLIAAKEEIQKSLNTSRKIGTTIISVLVLSMAVLYQQHLKNKKRMKLKFEAFMRNSENKTKPVGIDTEKMELDINPELLKNILINLEKFEKNHKYLEKDMTMVKLAPALKTNPKYAAKVILKYRGKKSIDYITDLKIDYIINLLKTENKYRNYTNKALAEEVGFNSTQKFTKAFKQKTEMSPTFFIQQLKKS